MLAVRIWLYKSWRRRPRQRRTRGSRSTSPWRRSLRTISHSGRCFFRGKCERAGRQHGRVPAHVQQIKSDGLAVILPTIAVMRSKRDAQRKVWASHPESRYGSTWAQFDAPKSSACGSKTAPPIEKDGNLLTLVELKARCEECSKCTSLDELKLVTKTLQRHQA